MTKRQSSSPSLESRASPFDYGGLAIWLWATSLLATREFWTFNYVVIHDAPPLWGFFAISLKQLVTLGGVTALVVLALRQPQSAYAPKGCRWLGLAILIPILDGARFAGIEIPATFFEPLWLAAITALAIGWSHGDKILETTDRPWPWVLIWTSASLACGYWIWEGLRSYDDFLLGFHDFGHFGRRVVNTWNGRGFLMETPSLPSFWDHFNPGLALLAPLWGLWSDSRLFLVLQGICLASPAPIIYATAQRLGWEKSSAAMLALSYLAYPAVGLLNLNFSYGWHPDSLCLPLLFAALWRFSAQKYIQALGCVILACSFVETCVVVCGCVFFAFCVAKMLRFELNEQETRDVWPDISAQTWFLLWGIWLAAFVLIYRYSGMANFQSTRFATQLSLAKLVQPNSVWFALCLFTPLGHTWIRRAWPFALASLPPLAFLMAWTYSQATCLSFQYTTCLIPVFFAGVLHGAPRYKKSALAILMSTLLCSWFFGSLPISGLIARFDKLTYPYLEATNYRSRGTESANQLEKWISVMRSSDASVLATSRIAAHLLEVKRLEPVNDAVDRWKAFANEVGPGKRPIELFDWVALDRHDQFQQSTAQIDFIRNEAIQADFETVFDQDGILILKRKSP